MKEWPASLEHCLWPWHTHTAKNQHSNGGLCCKQQASLKIAMPSFFSVHQGTLQWCDKPEPTGRHIKPGQYGCHSSNNGWQNGWQVVPHQDCLASINYATVIDRCLVGREKQVTQNPQPSLNIDLSVLPQNENGHNEYSAITCYKYRSVHV